MREPRGLRNNNPGNLNFAGQPGATLEEGVKEPRFARFPTMDDGLTALIRQLLLYFGRRRNTVRLIIEAWAPPTENATKAYANYVARDMAVKPDTVLSPSPAHMASLALAITHMENGENPFLFSHVFNLAIKEIERGPDSPVAA